MFKLEVRDEHGIWSDVRGGDGAVLTFDDEGDARAKLEALYPVLVKMEKYGDPKRTRVVRVFRTDEEWKEGTPPGPGSRA
jgi:hypothetical protein